MNKDMLVEIFVSFGTEEGNIATGYPIAPNRILTARHSLYSEKNNELGRIEVRWHYLKDKPEYDWQLEPATMIDCGLNDELDVALLDCQFPEGIDYYCNLEDQNPKKELKWESEGFARSGKRDDIRPATPLSGETYSAANNADWLVLTEKGKTEVPDLWRGISGAPVFVQETFTIIGVTVECPPNYDAVRLHATPAWKLLQCGGFRNEIAYDVRKEEIERILQEIAAMLSALPEVCEAFRVELNIQEVFTDEGKCSVLADILIKLPVDKLLQHCEAVMDRLIKAQKTAAIESVRELVNYFLPIVFDQRIIQQVCSISYFRICRVAVATETVAEIVMAGKDGRAAQYRQCANGREWPVGVWLLEEPPNNSGMKNTDRIGEFKKQIITDYAHIDALIKGQALSEAEQVRLAAEELEYCAENKRTRYYLYSFPKQKQEQEEQVALVNELKKCFSSIVFIECKYTVDIISRERRQYRSLINIHNKEVENPS